MIQARCWGGPNHNQVIAVKPGDPYLELQKYAGVRAANEYDYQNAGLIVPTKRGRYWLTPDTDKKGNPIYAWTGWK